MAGAPSRGVLARMADAPAPAWQLTQVCGMSKYISNARTKRLPLTTKRAGKGFYKGKGARTEGFNTSKGGFVRQRERCTELVMPDLTNCKLRAYVGSGAKRGMIDSKVESS